MHCISLGKIQSICTKSMLGTSWSSTLVYYCEQKRKVKMGEAGYKLANVYTEHIASTSPNKVSLFPPMINTQIIAKFNLLYHQ